MQLSTMVRARQAAFVALIAAIAFTLQGCGGNGVGGGSCEPIEFTGGAVAKAGNSEAGVVTCEDDGTNESPDLTCNWVGVACTAAEDDKRQCGAKFAFGLKDTGLKEWTVGAAPDVAKSEDDLSNVKFLVGIEDDAVFASKATQAAGLSRSEYLKKLKRAIVEKGSDALAAGKEKGAAALAAAKEKGGKALAAAKEKGAALAGGDDAKADDAKDAKADDAKADDAEKKRRLADAAKADDAKADAKAADAKADDVVRGIPIKASELKCTAKKEDAKADAKGDDAKADDAKDGDAKAAKADDAKADAKDTKLFSVGERVSRTSSKASSGWVTPIAGCLAVAGVALAAMKIARTRSARSRALDAGQHDEESSQEAIE